MFFCCLKSSLGGRIPTALYPLRSNNSAERSKFERDQRAEARRVEIEGLRYYREEAKREARAIELRQIRDYEVRSVTAASAKRDRAEAERGVRSALLRSHADGKRREAITKGGPRHLLLKGSRDFDLPIGLESPAATNGAGNAAYAAEYTLQEEDDAVDEAALREFAFILAKEDLIEHLEALVEMGCTHIEDLAAIDEKELVRMAPKVVHKRKLASLRKKYAA